MPAKSREPPLEGWKLLRARYQTRGIVLALGAGLSAGCGLPNWPELLCRVGERCLRQRGRQLVQNLLHAGMTLPAVAGILESKCPRRVRFTEVLREQLYRDFHFHSALRTAAQQRALVNYVNRHNATMRGVAALCVWKEMADAELEPNPRIHAVVNFNVDSVFRAYARARYDTFLFRTIERADKPQRVGRIPMYHMHGLLPFDRHERRDAEHEIRCVFTEGEYYDVFNQPHSVFNYTFLYLLREFNCLFIGLSMNDENIRRLLHYSTTERREQRHGPAKRQTALRHFAILHRTDSPQLDELVDTSLRRLGTRVLWLADYRELPERLAYVYGQQDWKQVY